ncbi:uncharacterized protein ccdc190 [Mustelus asterias]
MTASYRIKPAIPKLGGRVEALARTGIIFSTGDLVHMRNVGNGPSWSPRITMEKMGTVPYKVKVTDETLKKRLDHLRAWESLPEETSLPAMEMTTSMDLRMIAKRRKGPSRSGGAGRDQDHIGERYYDGHKAHGASSIDLPMSSMKMQRCYSTKAGRIVMPPTASLALQTQINDFLNGFSNRQEKSDGHTGVEETQPSTPSNKLKTPPVNSINMPSLNRSIAKHVSISEKPTGLDATNGRENQAADSQTGQESGDAEANSSATSDQAQRQISSPQLSACQESPPYDSEFYAPDGLLRTIHTMPSFLEAFAEAKKARYIRHRTKTDDEKELTISEIFGKRRQRLQDIVVKEVETSKEKNLTGKIPI